MTRTKLDNLTARVDWLSRVVGCLGAFEHCYWHVDLVRAEKALQEAAASKPKV
jgi:hypothetical protein